LLQRFLDVIFRQYYFFYVSSGHRIKLQ
jgi:hypothetical protein